MNVNTVRLLQHVLKEAGFYQGDIDGLRGSRTAKAVQRFVHSRRDELREPPDSWSDRRMAIACLQLACRDAGIEPGPVDGYWGPLTDNAVEELEQTRQTGGPPRAWRDEVPLETNPNDWPTETNLERRFGPPCEVPLVRVECPWELTIDWNRAAKTRTISCHEVVADSLTRVLHRVFEHYGEEEIRRLGLYIYGGSYNCRRMRGGTSWSTHAWGIAIDWYPSRNKLKWGRDRASLAADDCLDWWRFWEEEGWVSLGRCRNYDWMHVQAAKLNP